MLKKQIRLRELCVLFQGNNMNLELRLTSGPHAHMSIPKQPSRPRTPRLRGTGRSRRSSGRQLTVSYGAGDVYIQ